MLSGAGGAFARRRPEISWLSLLLGPLVFGSLLFSFSYVNLPKNPNLSSSSVFFFSDRNLWNGEREQCFKISLNQTSSINLSLNRATDFLLQSTEDAADQIWRLIRSGKQTKSDPVSRDDAAAQIWGLYHAGKQIKPDSALRPSSRHSATNPSPVGHLKVRPLPPPSTLTPALPSPSPACRSMANPPCLSLPSTRTPASTQHPVRPSNMTPASTQQLGGGASDTSTTGAALGFGLLGLRHCSGPPWLSRPNDEHTISSTSLIRPKTKLLFPNYVEMCLLDCLPRSESFAYDLAQESQMVYDRRPLMSSVTLFI